MISQFEFDGLYERLVTRCHRVDRPYLSLVSGMAVFGVAAAHVEPDLYQKLFVTLGSSLCRVMPEGDRFRQDVEAAIEELTKILAGRKVSGAGQSSE